MWTDFKHKPLPCGDATWGGGDDTHQGAHRQFQFVLLTQQSTHRKIKMAVVGRGGGGREQI